MVYSVYSIYDCNVGYSAPAIQENDAVAMRLFANGCSDKSSIWYTHSSDFCLMRIGTFDTITGELSCEDPVRLCTASDAINSMNID